ncbi:hypothetical protein KBC86_01800 [Candidatus Gracilibacteria bacterium]|nr:hypothetical protein [Candidatus Gracilibacteria bacterium]
MVVKKSHAAVSDEANTESGESKVVQKTPKKVLDQTKNKGCVDRCLDNPGFPWMIIALLFTLLVIMFWKDHYNNYYKMGRGNVFYKEWRTGDDHSGGMMDRGQPMRRWGSEQVAPTEVLPE